MSLAKYDQLTALVEELLTRFGIVAHSPIDMEEATPQDVADRLAGIEGYSLQLNAMTYILLPEDVQETLLLMASTIYADSDDDDYFLDNEEE